MDLALKSLIAFTPGLVMPGPDALMILKTSLENRKKGLFLTLGILLADCLYKFIAVFGLSSFLLKNHSVFITVRILGIIFLFYLGVSSVWSAFKNKFNQDETQVLSKKKLFLNGFLVNISNPMAIIFVTSVTVSLLDANSSLLDKWILFWVMSLDAIAWFLAIWYFSSFRIMNHFYISNSKIISIISGFVLIFFSLSMLWNLIYNH